MSAILASRAFVASLIILVVGLIDGRRWYIAMLSGLLVGLAYQAFIIIRRRVRRSRRRRSFVNPPRRGAR